MQHVTIERGADFDLFSATAGCQSVGDKRKANDDECRAYARWLAMRAGIVEAVTNSPKLEWKNFDRRGRERVCIGAYFGDAFVAFPGADQNGAVTFELLDESGNVETSGTIYAKPNGALNIAAADASAMKESAKAWSKANKGKSKAAPVAPPIAEPAPVAPVSGELTAPESATETPQDDAPATTLAGQSEIAPQDEKIGLPDDVEAQPDPIAALMARMDALESRLESLSSVDFGPQGESATKCEKLTYMSTSAPIAAIETDAPLSGELRAKRSPAHVRAIMAYLAMRKARNAERKHNAIGMQQLDAMRADRDDWQKIAEQNAQRCDEWESLQQRTWEQAMGFKMQRRRAILKALTLRSNLRLSRDIAADRLKQIVDMSDRLISESSKATTAETCARAAENREAALKSELSSLKAKIADPSNPVRESDMLMLKGNAEAWQAKAEAAIAESERLKRLALQNAGHIETLASRVARAETMLRESGALPVLKLVPPTASVAA